MYELVFVYEDREEIINKSKDLEYLKRYTYEYLGEMEEDVEDVEIIIRDRGLDILEYVDDYSIWEERSY